MEIDATGIQTPTANILNTSLICANVTSKTRIDVTNHCFQSAAVMWIVTWAPFQNLQIPVEEPFCLTHAFVKWHPGTNNSIWNSCIFYIYTKRSNNSNTYLCFRYNRSSRGLGISDIYYLYILKPMYIAIRLHKNYNAWLYSALHAPRLPYITMIYWQGSSHGPLEWTVSTKWVICSTLRPHCAAVRSDVLHRCIPFICII